MWGKGGGGTPYPPSLFFLMRGSPPTHGPGRQGGTLLPHPARDKTPYQKRYACRICFSVVIPHETRDPILEKPAGFRRQWGEGVPPTPLPSFFLKGGHPPPMQQGGWGVPPLTVRGKIPEEPGKEPGKTGKVLRSFFQVPAVYNPVGSMTV